MTESFISKKYSYDRFAKIQNDILNSKDSEIKIVLDIKNRLGFTFVFLVVLFHLLCKREKWHKIQNGNRAGKSKIGLPPIIAY